MSFSLGRFARKSGVGIAVLLFHVVLWFAVRNANDATRFSSAPAPQVRYLTLVQPARAVEQTTPTYRSFAPVPKIRTQAARTAQKPSTAGQTTQHSHATIAPSAASIRSAEPAVARSASPAASLSSSDASDSNPAKQGLTLDYEAMKKSARESAAGHQDKTLPGASRRTTESEKLENAVARTRRGDCANQHAHLGLLAIPFLLKDTLTDTGCKW